MEDTSEADKLQPAIAHPETARALRRRGWAIFARGAVGFVIVNGVNSLLGTISHGGVVAVFLAAVLLTGMIIFCSAFWSYAGHLRTRYVLRRGPWRESEARAVPVGIGTVPFACIVELDEQIVRSVRPLRWARSLPVTARGTVWVAGRDGGVSVISPEGGAFPLHASGWWSGLARRLAGVNTGAGQGSDE